MKYVDFKSVKIKNFLSIGEDPVTVNFTQGIHIITGINRDKEDRRNGVGKSTIADALYFAIFGTTLRKLKKEFIYNNITQKTCEVQLEFNVQHGGNTHEYTIIRTLSPSRLLLFKDGVDITRDSIANTNAHIEHVLSSSPEIFQNCVIMTLNDTTPFMSKSNVEKRKFIEQIFNLEVFSEMLSALRDEHNSTKKDLDIEVMKHSEIKTNIDIYNKQKDSKIKEKENAIANIRRNMTQNESELLRVKTQLASLVDIDVVSKNKELDTFSKALEKVDEKMTQLKVSIATYTSDLKQKQSTLNKIGTDKDVCSACLRPLFEHDIEHVVTEKNNLQGAIKKLLGDIDNDKKAIEDLVSKRDKIVKHISKLVKEIKEAEVQDAKKAALSKRIEDLDRINKQLEDSIQNVTIDSAGFDTLIEDATKRLKDVGDKITSIKKTLDLLEVVKFVISEEGVKSYIVKRILQNFNAKLAYYLKKLDSNSICIFNEYFEEEILNEKGKICSYNNFSGAERKAIDLACLFAFIDMRKSQGDVHYNISIYDELFDTSLDQRGVELVIDILKERVSSYNESIFIISHRKESTKAIDGEVIFLEKLNGITKRINFVD